MKIQIQITLDLNICHGKSTQEKIASVSHAVGRLVSECGNFSSVDSALFVTEGK